VDAGVGEAGVAAAAVDPGGTSAATMAAAVAVAVPSTMIK